MIANTTPMMFDVAVNISETTSAKLSLKPKQRDHEYSETLNRKHTMSYEDQLIREMTTDQGPLEQDAESPNESNETSDAEQAAIDRLFSSLNHIGYSAVTGPIDKPCQCEACAKEQRDASHLNTPDSTTAQPLTLDQTESFCDYLDSKGDTLAPPDSFDQWLKEREDSI